MIRSICEVDFIPLMDWYILVFLRAQYLNACQSWAVKLKKKKRTPFYSFSMNEDEILNSIKEWTKLDYYH